MKPVPQSNESVYKSVLLNSAARPLPQESNVHAINDLHASIMPQDGIQQSTDNAQITFVENMIMKNGAVYKGTLLP